MPEFSSGNHLYAWRDQHTPLFGAKDLPNQFLLMVGKRSYENPEDTFRSFLNL